MQDLSGQGWQQLLALFIALLLCSLIGLERQLRQKSAGLRTHTLVGLGAALFMVISKFGFGDVVGGAVTLDPSRVAAQIVSGVGFIGAGLIFVRQDIVRGLTTAATIWLAAAVGTAAGAGLWLLATAVTAAHFLVAYCYPWLVRRITDSPPATLVLDIRYADGRGVLRTIMAEATERRFAVQRVDTRRTGGTGADAFVDMELGLRGEGDPIALAVALSETDGVLSVVQSDTREDA
ncbi:MgtC/SapB family protein [Nocardiopsis sediminis]|uniref:MgtC/SapB family protein n=1 Tax=Nocardiopsis sediminis TaxID=1778267 RepID=A0ABV8FM53_9ACTN